jgi:HD-GYP domain-containing protein (c-di-GMP phosphodiesterase class II)
MNQIITIDIRKAVIALSDALDLVGVDEVQHGKRVAYIAVQCARRLGLDEESCNELFEIGLIHDIGVSETSVHKHLIEESEWDDENHHCQVGFELIKDYAPLSEYA